MNYKKMMSMWLWTIVPFVNVAQINYAIEFKDNDQAKEWGKKNYEKLLDEKLTAIEKKHLKIIVLVIIVLLINI